MSDVHLPRLRGTLVGGSRVAASFLAGCNADRVVDGRDRAGAAYPSMGPRH